jgi:hypothetical protein
VGIVSSILFGRSRSKPPGAIFVLVAKYIQVTEPAQPWIFWWLCLGTCKDPNSKYIQLTAWKWKKCLTRGNGISYDRYMKWKKCLTRGNEKMSYWQHLKNPTMKNSLQLLNFFSIVRIW